MMPRRRSAAGALILCALTGFAASGCALTSKSPPTAPRYFSPERAGEVVRPSARLAGRPVELRLGRVHAAAHLDERLVFRDADNYELGYYQERRWTEAPEHYLRRRLGRVLFEERGIQHVIGGDAMTLVVELGAFEEVRTPKRLARVQVTVRLQNQRSVRWQETLTAEQPVAVTASERSADALVEALGTALRGVVDRIADRAGVELTASRDEAEARPAAPKHRR